jgi:hypothetical protein
MSKRREKYMGSHPFVPYWVQNPSLVFTRRLYTLKIADGAHVAGVFIRKEDHVIFAARYICIDFATKLLEFQSLKFVRKRGEVKLVLIRISCSNV